jgi:hypothetical protein
MKRYVCLILAGISLLCILVSASQASTNKSLDNTEQTKLQPVTESEAAEEQPNAETGDSGKRVPGASPDFQAPGTEASSLSRAIRSPIFVKAVSRWFGRLQPNQGGTIWIFILVTIIVAFDFRNITSWRNADLLLLLVLCFLLIDLIDLGGGWSPVIQNPAKKFLFAAVFLGIFLVSITLLIRALVRAFKSKERTWTPNIQKRALVAVVIILFACTALLALGRFPDDCGNYINMGTSRMLETGKFPYGDPELRGGAAATYGPVLYLAHVPFQLVLSHIDHSVAPEEHPINHWIVMGGTKWYFDAPVLATKLTLLLFHLLGVIGLIMIGRQLREPAVGWGLACLYIGSAYVQGMGGEKFFITGMTYISHIAPAAVTILAFAMLDRPIWAGALLAIATGTLFYPAFFFPLWLGYYVWKRKEWHKFAAGFILVCLVIFTITLLMTQSPENQSAFKAIYESTVGHQEAKDAYGSSTFSFWGTHPRLAAFWQKSFIEGRHLFKPSFLLFMLFIIATFFMARGRTITQLAFLTAAVAIAVQLWKSHAGGTYVEWYYPFFLIGLLGQQTSNSIDPKLQTALELET